MTDTDTTTGRPLTAEVIRTIRMRHEPKVPRELRQPNGLTPVLHATPDVLAYDPRTGTRLGSLADRTIVAHRDSLVCLSTRRLPEPGELEAIRVTDDGKVVMP